MDNTHLYKKNELEAYMENITMSKKEIKRIPVMQKLSSHEITQRQAGRMLGVNIFARYKQNGAKRLVHRLRGRPGNNMTDSSVVQRVVAMAQDPLHAGYGPTELSEELQLKFDITAHAETIRAIMVKEGLWKVKKRKAQHRKLRERKESFGQMMQFDGSEHGLV